MIPKLLQDVVIDFYCQVRLSCGRIGGNPIVRIHEKLGSLRAEDRLGAWVYQITRNVIVDYFRKRSRISDESDLAEFYAEDEDQARVQRGRALAEQMLDDCCPSGKMSEDGWRKTRDAIRDPVTADFLASFLEELRLLLREVMAIEVLYPGRLPQQHDTGEV